MPYFTCLLLLCCLIGCESTPKGPKFPPATVAPGQAVIYVYRPSPSYFGSALAIEVKCDGKRIGAVQKTGYISTVVAPGIHRVSAKTEIESEVIVDAKAGQSYFIEMDVHFGAWVGRPQLTPVPEETGQLAIQQTKLSVVPELKLSNEDRTGRGI